MSLSPPISEPIESPIFEAGSPLNLRNSPRDVTRFNFGLFGEVSDSEVEVNTHTHIPIGSTPKTFRYQVDSIQNQRKVRVITTKL